MRSHHEKEYGLVRDLPQSRLAIVLGERRERAYQEHDAECPTCWRYARTCLACGVDLTAKPHRFRCPENVHRWRGLFRTRTPPLAHEARRRPRALETPPPRRTTLEPVRPPRPAPPRAPAPAAPRAAPPPAAPPPTAPPAAAPPAPPAPPPPPKKPSAHEILGLAPGASVAEIRAAYREKAMDYHPDRVASLAPEFKRIAEQRMRDINAAYEELLRMVAAQR